jgi:Carboxymuconolactone decarboxylase family
MSDDARIAPLEPPYSEAVTAALERIMPPGVAPLVLFRTLAVNERVFLRLMAGGLLDRGSITLREREIVIDRTCARCGAEYEWGVHVTAFAAAAGLTAEQTASIARVEADLAPLLPRDRLLVRMVDELHETCDVSDALWAELAGVWTAPQLIELLLLAGWYRAISYVCRVTRVPLEDWQARFARD